MYVCAVEDESELQEILKELFQDQGSHYQGFTSVEALKEELDQISMDVLLLDRRLSGQDGLSFLGEFRQDSPSFPIVVLTGQGSPEERMEGTRFGATDYITKPCHFPELLLKLQTVVNDPYRKQEFYRNGWRISDADQSLNYKTNSIRFSSLEFSIFRTLAQRISELVTYEELEKVTGDLNRNTVSAHIKSVRSKLAKTPFKIQAARNLGYRVFVTKE